MLRADVPRALPGSHERDHLVVAGPGRRVAVRRSAGAHPTRRVDHPDRLRRGRRRAACRPAPTRRVTVPRAYVRPRRSGGRAKAGPRECLVGPVLDVRDPVARRGPRDVGDVPRVRQLLRVGDWSTSPTQMSYLPVVVRGVQEGHLLAVGREARGVVRARGSRKAELGFSPSSSAIEDRLAVLRVPGELLAVPETLTSSKTPGRHSSRLSRPVERTWRSAAAVAGPRSAPGTAARVPAPRERDPERPRRDRGEATQPATMMMRPSGRLHSWGETGAPGLPAGTSP